MTTDEMATFLIKRGWQRRPFVSSPWQWIEPQFPGAQHTLQHAYDIELSKGKTRVPKTPASIVAEMPTQPNLVAPKRKRKSASRSDLP